MKSESNDVFETVEMKSFKLDEPKEDPKGITEEEIIRDLEQFWDEYLEQQQKKRDAEEKAECKHDPLNPQVHIKAICGNDYRTQITNVSGSSPAHIRSMCHLNIYKDDDTRSICSGFLTDDGKVVTAAHCLCDPDTGSKLTAAYVLPGVHITSSGDLKVPFGRGIVNYARAPGQWCDDGDWNYDWAVLWFENDDLWQRTGNARIPMYDADASDLSSHQFQAIGYPGDLSDVFRRPKMFTSATEDFTQIDPAMLHGKHDSWNGMSGGPILNVGQGAAGITSHHYENCARDNGFTRLRTPVKNYIQSWNPR